MPEVRARGEFIVQNANEKIASANYLTPHRDGGGAPLTGGVELSGGALYHLEGELTDAIPKNNLNRKRYHQMAPPNITLPSNTSNTSPKYI